MAKRQVRKAGKSGKRSKSLKGGKKLEAQKPLITVKLEPVNISNYSLSGHD